MRYDKHQKVETCGRLVGLASARIRESGADSLRVGNLMHMAESTPGGFYQHFESREDPVDHAFEQTNSGSVRRWSRITSQAQAGQHVIDLVNFYVSETRRLNVANGRALLPLSAEVPRANATSRRAFAAERRDMIAILAEHMAVAAEDARAEAITTASLLVGLLLLPQAANDAGLAKESLRATKLRYWGCGEAADKDNARESGSS